LVRNVRGGPPLFGGTDGDEEGDGDPFGIFESGGPADDGLAGRGCLLGC
jgi:hypothetical protein